MSRNGGRSGQLFRWAETPSGSSSLGNHDQRNRAKPFLPTRGEIVNARSRIDREVVPRAGADPGEGEERAGTYRVPRPLIHRFGGSMRGASECRGRGWKSPPGPGPSEVEERVLLSRPLPKTAGPLGGMNRTPANHMMSNAPVHLRPPPRTAPSGGGRGSERRPTGATVSSTKPYWLSA